MKDRKRPLIVYVDDEAANRLVFEANFADRFNVLTVASGAEALAVLDRERVAVLVSDQRMPGMTGSELLAKARETHPEVMRMIITAYSDLDPILRAVNQGLVARYVVKPWDRDALAQMLHWGLQTYQLGAEHAEMGIRILALERLATLGTLHASMMHDLKQPVACIQANVDLLKNAAASSGALRTLVSHASEALAPNDRCNLEWLAAELPALTAEVLQGCALIGDLLRGVQRLVAPVDRESKRATDPTVGISFAVAVCRRVVLSAGAELDADEPNELPPLHLGGAELAQVLINLLSNAAQAVARRSSRGGHVRLAWRDVGTHLELSVSDDGLGMSPEVLEKAGTPFFSTRSEGTGLGLSQCRRIVEGAGGTLTLESHEGAGTSVVFTVRKQSL